MTIAPIVPYNGETHIRLVNINLDLQPSVVHFRLGHFDGDAPAMPYSAEDAPANWVERTERAIESAITTKKEADTIVEAISSELQAHA